MFSRLVNEMAEKQGVTEQLKATKPMLWVGKMNAVRSTAILKDQRLLFNTFIQKQYVETLCLFKSTFHSIQETVLKTASAYRGHGTYRDCSWEIRK